MSAALRPYWICLRAKSGEVPYLIGVTYAATARDARDRMMPGACVLPCGLTSGDVLARVPADLAPLATYQCEVASLPSWRDAHAPQDLSSASYCEANGIDWT